MGFDDTARLATLDDYRVLDSEAEKSFDNLTELASKILDAPISLVSLVAKDRQWFKSRCGIAAQETPREWAFCDHALRDDATLLVPDARLDSRFAANPLVLGEPHIRFYCGVPLRSPEGHGLGTLCIIDREPRHLSPTQVSLLQALARQVELELEIRRRLMLLEEKLGSTLSAVKSRELLASMIVHDMRGPLTGITMSASMIRPADDESAQHLEMLIGQADRLRHMLVDILDVCLHEKGRLKVRPRIFDALQLTRQVADRLTRARAETGVDLTVAGRGPMPVHADPELTTRVLENLLLNAIDHAGATPRITINMRQRPDDRVEFEVLDQGTTIPEELRSRVFEPWTRGAMAMHRGHGLGLAMCRLAVESHDGRIRVQPNPAGKGNAFVFDLPGAAMP